MATTDTLSSADEALQYGKDVDPIIKDIIDALFTLWDGEDRVRAIQDEICRHPDFDGDDREFLDLPA